jgi:dihydrofolate reductase (trimethoprim resistance protein)
MNAKSLDLAAAFEWLRRLSLGEMVMMRPEDAAVVVGELNRLQKLERSNGWPPTHTTFALGDAVEKTKGSSWHGRIVGWYSTDLTPEGYAVESDFEPGSVQIYPAAALRLTNLAKDLNLFTRKEPVA